MDFYSGTYILQQMTKWDLQNCSITDLQPDDSVMSCSNKALNRDFAHVYKSLQLKVKSEQHVAMFLQKQMLDGESS